HGDLWMVRRVTDGEAGRRGVTPELRRAWPSLRCAGPARAARARSRRPLRTRRLLTGAGPGIDFLTDEPMHGQVTDGLNEQLLQSIGLHDLVPASLERWRPLIVEGVVFLLHRRVLL